MATRAGMYPLFFYKIVCSDFAASCNSVFYFVAIRTLHSRMLVSMFVFYSSSIRSLAMLTLFYVVEYPVSPIELWIISLAGLR